jgi:SAM-dependent methyltransferase
MRRASAPAALLAALALFLFLRRNLFGWTFLGFPDEAGHMLGALALHAGDTLYGTYVDAHGPMVFMLTQLYGVLSGWGDITYARSLCTALALLAGLAIASSAALTGARERWLGTGLFFGALATVWLPQYLYVDNYHVIGGTFAALALALGVIPAWRGNAGLRGMFLAGACLGFAAFTAYSYAPSIVLFGASMLLATPQRRRARTALWLGAGSIAGSAVVLLWLARFGSIGGYIAFHIVANQRDYAPYVGHLSIADFLGSFVPRSAPDARGHMVGVVCFLAALPVAVARAWNGVPAPRMRAVAVLLGFAGIALLNLRGSAGFVDGAFLVAAIGAAALVLPPGLARLPPVLAPALIALGLLAAERFVQGATLSRTRILAAEPFHYLPDDQPISREIRRIVRPDERFLALVYTPWLFLSAGRLPMAKYHDYLPWEADYARHPWSGHVRDLCTDLARSPPPLVSFDGWTVWDRYAPADFMPCVPRLLAAKYAQDSGFPTLYVRRDRAATLPKKATH